MKWSLPDNIKVTINNQPLSSLGNFSDSVYRAALRPAVLLANTYRKANPLLCSSKSYEEEYNNVTQEIQIICCENIAENKASLALLDFSLNEATAEKTWQMFLPKNRNRSSSMPLLFCLHYKESKKHWLLLPGD